MPDRKGPDVPDGFDFRPDGTILLHIDNQRWRLKRPKLGEFRRLRELLRENEDAHRAILTEQAMPSKPEDGASDDAKRDYLAAVVARSRTITDQAETLNIGWVAAVIATLHDGPQNPPADDDLPEGCETTEFVQSLVTHWRTVPLRSGGG